jgi:hypothetical protein
MDERPADRPVRKTYQVRLPGFLGEEVGLGDVIKRTTAIAGIRPCGGCARRAAALNERIMFSGRQKRAFASKE